MRKLWNKILLGLGIIEEDRDVIDEGGNPAGQSWKKNNIVEFPSQANNLKLVVKKPLAFAEVESIGEHLKMKRAVVINFEEMEPSEAIRAVDFLSGVTFAAGGYSQKINRYIFLFTPAEVSLDVDFHRNINRDSALGDG